MKYSTRKSMYVPQTSYTLQPFYTGDIKGSTYQRKIDKKKIEMPASIKEFGSYDAKVRLHVGVVAAFKVKVEEAPL